MSAPIKCEPPAGSTNQPDVRSSTRLCGVIAAEAQHFEVCRANAAFSDEPVTIAAVNENVIDGLWVSREAHEKGGPEAAF
uniref:Uncharacterized protein n=1 Tax=Bradyrhizobium zhengyangense TaxID=2911009 RepID=A0A9X1R3C8_9BRAD|nr:MULTISPECIES: hypothetical protein [Bradyrhizobium]MCG2625116.1 hypothetical protein [Bradyrhizobium zhengyangense]MCG2641559.1 hypothetical protein [Bradyrhizobium zhengyangense]MCG2667186.1 hypothetical protein [Bradyrhizobium zhengyangense]